MKRSSVVVVASVALLCFCAAAPAQLKEAEQPATANPTAPTVEQMEKFLYLVDHFARLSENPTSSAIGAVLQA
ncbi:MAG TPA: hypothetical protein VGI81_09885, partial [Tepidisphaeraceae bacterium]